MKTEVTSKQNTPRYLRESESLALARHVLNRRFENESSSRRRDGALRSLAAVADSTAYPHVIERTQIMFTQAKQIGGEPQLVADLVEKAISDPEPRLRYMVGDSAQVFFDGRARMSDEEWIALGRHTTAQDYFQEWGARFPMPS